MYTLENALAEHDLIVLRVIGEWWELDLSGADKPACIKQLSEALAGLNMVQEIEYLGPEEAKAFDALVDNGGQMPVAVFERQFGEVRQMGPGRLEREEPWLDPISPAEALWYRGFLFRRFREEADGQIVELYCLPAESYKQFRAEEKPAAKAAKHVEPAASLSVIDQPQDYRPAVTDAVDDLTTILAVAQNRPLKEDNLAWLDPLLIDASAARRSLLITLASELGFLRQTDEGVRPARPAIDWLQQSREEQLRVLVDAWSSSSWNDLCHTPTLKCEGSGWQNEPILARTTLLDVLPRQNQWFNLVDLVNLIKDIQPDFQRPDGNYETWYIRDRQTGAFLSGFQQWDAVEGRLLQFLIAGPLGWLGQVDLSADDQLFRPTTRSLAWLRGEAPPETEIDVPIVVRDDASMLVPFNANRYTRFQAARISEAQPVTPGKPFVYRLTPQSLESARQQGIEAPRVLQFLAKASERPVPASTRRAIERWSEQGTEGRIEQVILLRVRDVEILDKLRANQKTRPFLGEALGDLVAEVRPQDWQSLCQAAAQLGLLLDIQVPD
jgi:hypothetical protein